MKEKGEKESIHADHRQRMRERIAHGGIDGLSDHEVLEYLLYPFIPRKSLYPAQGHERHRARTHRKIFNA